MNPAELQMLAQVIRDRYQGRLMVRLTWLLAACTLAVIIAGSIGARIMPNLLILFLVSGLGYLWCGAFLKSAVQQNLPSNACLVPGLRVNLMRVTAKLYIACTLLTALLSGLLVGHPGYGLVLGGLLSCYVLLSQRYWINLLPSVVIVVALTLVEHPLDKLIAYADMIGEPMVAAIGVLVLSALGSLALRMAFPQGGDRHWTWYRCQARMEAKNRGEVLVGEPGGGLRWLASLRKPYNAALRKDSRPGAAQGRQMMHTLGTAAYDGGAIASAVVTAAIMVVVGRYVAGKGDATLTLLISTMMQGLLMMSVLMYANTVALHAMRFSGEQALYCLTPAAPDTAAFNRVLMKTLMRRWLLLWLVSVAAIVCIDFVVLGQSQMRGVTFALAMMVLPFAGLLMRDYAGSPYRPSSIVAVATSFLVLSAYLVLAFVSQMHPELPLFWFGSGVALLTVMVLGLRWRQLMALPPLLPAGRLAT